MGCSVRPRKRGQDAEGMGEARSQAAEAVAGRGLATTSNTTVWVERRSHFIGEDDVRRREIGRRAAAGQGRHAEVLRGDQDWCADQAAMHRAHVCEGPLVRSWSSL